MFDGGKDPASPQFAAAFEVVRKLNQEILAQNELVDRDQRLPEASFQTRAIRNWLDLHAGSTKHLPPPERGVPSRDGTLRWRPEVASDAELITLLDRYCYRCHSSLRYNVFDKELVRKRCGNMAEFIDMEFMPPDRKLDPAVKARLIELLEGMKQAE